MARPDTNHEERKAQILQAAIRVFAQYGFDGTSNKLIAEQITREYGGTFSPALIYHYFDSKYELFKASVEQFPPPHILGGIIRDNQNQPPELFFREVGYNFLKQFTEQNNYHLLRMVVTEIPRNPELAGILAGEIVPVILVPFVGYIQRQMAAGQLKPGNPFGMLLQFIGPFYQYLLAKSLGFADKFPIPIPSIDEFVETTVGNFLTGAKAGRCI